MTGVYTNPDILMQPVKLVCSKFEILNRDFMVIERIEGSVQSGTIDVNAESDIRRTANIVMTVTDSTFEPNDISKLWMGRYIKIYIGLKDIVSDKIIYWNKGIYNFSTLNYTYNTTTNTVSVSCVDLMSELNGMRNGFLDAQTVKIEAQKGTKISKVITDILDNNTNFKKYIIEEIGSEYSAETSVYTGEYYTDLPYDIEINGEATIYNIFKELCDIYPNWEMYFDEEGIFHVSHIPSKDSDPIFIEKEIINPLVVSENSSIDYTKIANVISVWGKLLETDRYANSSTFSDGTFNITLEGLSSEGLLDGLMISFKSCTDNNSKAYLTINTQPPIPILTEDGNNPVFEKDKMYVLKYNKLNNILYYLGEPQVYGKYEVTNDDNPFSIQKIDRVAKNFSGGEFDNIYSSELAYQRAKWEAYKATILQETVTLNSILIPWIDVNKKIEYTSKRNGATKIFLAKNINFDISQWTMNITMYEFYPFYEFD